MMESDAKKDASRTSNSSATLTSPRGNGNQREIILSDVPAKVQTIKIDGLERTKNDIVTKHVQPVLLSKNFEEMVKAAQFAKFQMEQLGLFKAVSINVDVSKGPTARPDGYEITFAVKEHRRVTGGMSTLVGTNEGSVVCSMRLPNVVGRGEKVNSDITYGSKNALGWSLNFSKPLQGDPKLHLQAGIFQNSVDLPWSGYKELGRGLFAEFMFPTSLGAHSLRWEGTWRELSCLTRTTAFAVREQAGHSLKSAVRHTWARDTRDSRVLPNTGTLFKLIHEVAGLGGDAQYLKQEAEFQVNKQLFLDSVVQFSFAAGIVNGLFPGTKLNIMDRIFLGGPLTLRGFNIQGVGPHDEDCALGADAYWCSGLHLYTPLPFRPGKGSFGEYFRTHFFVNAGNLTALDRHVSWRDNLSGLAETLRLSYGAGIVLRLGGIARLEVNYCVPVRSQKGDSVNHGLQFGVGIKFL